MTSPANSGYRVSCFHLITLDPQDQLFQMVLQAFSVSNSDEDHQSLNSNKSSQLSGIVDNPGFTMVGSLDKPHPDCLYIRPNMKQFLRFSHCSHHQQRRPEYDPSPSQIPQCFFLYSSRICIMIGLTPCEEQLVLKWFQGLTRPKLGIELAPDVTRASTPGCHFTSRGITRELQQLCAPSFSGQLSIGQQGAPLATWQPSSCLHPHPTRLVLPEASLASLDAMCQALHTHTLLSCLEHASCLHPDPDLTSKVVPDDRTGTPSIAPTASLPADSLLQAVGSLFQTWFLLSDSSVHYQFPSWLPRAPLSSHAVDGAPIHGTNQCLTLHDFKDSQARQVFVSYAAGFELVDRFRSLHRRVADTYAAYEPVSSHLSSHRIFRLSRIIILLLVVSCTVTLFYDILYRDFLRKT